MNAGMQSKKRTDAVSAIVLVPALFVAMAVGFLAKAAQRPSYPKINVSTSYEVDPSWPQRPESVEWGPMPGVAVDSHDRVWVFTRARPPVQIYDTQGKFLGGWGEKEIKTAHYIKVEKDGSVWVADIGNHLIMQFTQEGKLLRELGTRGMPGDDASHFNMPTDMVVAPSGDVFISDGYGNNRVVHFDRSGKFVKTWGKLGAGPGELSLPHAITMDSKGRIFVADRNNARVQVFDQAGRLLEVWRDLLVPWGFCRLPNDEFWICGSSPMTWEMTDRGMGVPPKDQLLMRFSSAGKLLQLWTVPKGVDGQEKPGELNWVHGIAVDSAGNIYAGDIAGKRVQKFVRKAPTPH